MKKPMTLLMIPNVYGEWFATMQQIRMLKKETKGRVPRSIMKHG